MMLLRGIDHSDHQGAINWPVVRAAGYDFAIQKFTEGKHYTSARIDANWPAMRAEGFIRGAYHYMRWEWDQAKAEADYFVKRLERAGYEPDDMNPFLDVEWNTAYKRNGVLIPEHVAAIKATTNAQIQDRALAWCDRVHELTDRWPVFYTIPSFIRYRFNAKPLREFDIWIADYDVPEAKPAFVPWPDWVIHQTSGSARVPGVSSAKCDTNVFRGDREALKLALTGLK